MGAGSLRRFLWTGGLLAAIALVGCADEIGEEIHRPGIGDPFIVDPSGTGIAPQAPTQTAGPARDDALVGRPRELSATVRVPPDPLKTGPRDSEGKTVANDPRRKMLEDPGRVSVWIRDPSVQRRDTESGHRVEVYVLEPSVTTPPDPTKRSHRRVTKQVYRADVKSQDSKSQPRPDESKGKAADDDQQSADRKDQGAPLQRREPQTP